VVAEGVSRRVTHAGNGTGSADSNFGRGTTSGTRVEGRRRRRPGCRADFALPSTVGRARGRRGYAGYVAVVVVRRYSPEESVLFSSLAYGRRRFLFSKTRPNRADLIDPKQNMFRVATTRDVIFRFGSANPFYPHPGVFFRKFRPAIPPPSAAIR